jgi:RNase P/RNase MRP subunit p29
MGISLDTGRDVIVLTADTTDTIIHSGESVNVYGTAGDDHITLESGARAKLTHFRGNNTITIESDSGGFTVCRSGARVTFEGNDGTLLKIPATRSLQTIEFNDEAFSLTIESRAVLLGGQRVTMVPASIDGND